MRYVAFLRGINSGQNPTVKGEALREAFESLGFENVKTVLASGNVVFDGKREARDRLTKRLEAALAKDLRFQVPVVLRTVDELERLVAANPFGGVDLKPETRPHVTFLQDKPRRTLSLPVEVPEKGYTILSVVDATVCSVVDLTAGKTPDLMRRLDREFGPEVTTRTWATVERVLRAAS